MVWYFRYTYQMKLVLLAAGKGERMRPLTLHTPKPLIVYRGKPALDHLFEVLPNSIDEVIIAIDYLGDQIRAHCGSLFYGKKIHYVRGDAKGNALGFLESRSFIGEGERFAVSYADDILTSQEIRDCMAHEFSWLCYRMAAPQNVGIVEVDRDHYVKAFVEKPETPTSTLVADGFMVINSDIFSYTPMLHNKKQEYYFADMMARFCLEHKVRAVVGDSHHSQLTSPEDIDRLNRQS